MRQAIGIDPDDSLPLPKSFVGLSGLPDTSAGYAVPDWLSPNDESNASVCAFIHLILRLTNACPQWVDRMSLELIHEAESGRWPKVPLEDLELEVVRVRRTSPTIRRRKAKLIWLRGRSRRKRHSKISVEDIWPRQIRVRPLGKSGMERTDGDGLEKTWSVDYPYSNSSTAQKGANWSWKSIADQDGARRSRRNAPKLLSTRLSHRSHHCHL